MLFSAFILMCFALPLQFALNPTANIDLAIIRVAILILFIFLLFYVSKKKFLSQIKNSSTYSILAFLFLAIFSLLFSHNLEWSLRKLAFLFSIFPIYFIALALTTTPERKRKTIVALVFGATIVAIFSLIQFSLQFWLGIDSVYDFLAKSIMPFFIGHNFSQEVLAYPSWLVNNGGITYMRAFAPFPDPHMLSFYMGMLLPWSIALWATSKVHKKLFLISSLLLLICDIATFTRGGYIALILSAILILPVLSRKNAWKLFIAISLLIIIFFVAPKSLFIKPVAERMSSTFNVNEGSNKERIAIWQEAFPILIKHPLGVGIGLYPLEIDSSATYRTPIYTHNVYLDIAVELGIFATLAFILLLITTIGKFYELSKNNSFYTAGIASIFIFSIHSMVENPLYSVHVLPLLLIIVAISAANEITTPKK